MFGERRNIKEAYMYVTELAKSTDEPIAVLTAVHVMMNTIAKEIEKNGTRRDSMKVTKEQLLAWLGSDATKDTLASMLLEIANGEYEADALQMDIFAYNEGEQT
jgi:hypothetical protein